MGRNLPFLTARPVYVMRWLSLLSNSRKHALPHVQHTQELAQETWACSGQLGLRCKSGHIGEREREFHNLGAAEMPFFHLPTNCTSPGGWI